MSVLGGATPLYLFTLVAELILACLCLGLNRLVGTTSTGIFFIFGTLLIGLNFPLRNPAGLDVQGLLLYSILSLVALIAGLVLPIWVIWVAGAVLIGATIPGVLLTPLSSQLHALGSDPDAIRLGAFSLLIANQALVALFSWVSARSAGAGVHGAVRAVERERELAALKDQFLLDANHELRTPIMAWYNNLELLSRLDERLSPPQHAKIPARALNSGNAVRRILATMLDPTVVGMSTPRVTLAPVALGPLVKSVVETFDPLLVGEPGLENLPHLPRSLTVEVLGDLVVLADADRTRQILINLLTNAVKNSPHETPISITAVAVAQSRLHGKARQRSKQDNASSTEQVRVCVRDYGAGIPTDDVPKLFQRLCASNAISPDRCVEPVLASISAACWSKTWVDASGSRAQGFQARVRASTSPFQWR